MLRQTSVIFHRTWSAELSLLRLSKTRGCKQRRLVCKLAPNNRGLPVSWWLGGEELPAGLRSWNLVFDLSNKFGIQDLCVSHKKKNNSNAKGHFLPGGWILTFPTKNGITDFEKRKRNIHMFSSPTKHQNCHPRGNHAKVGQGRNRKWVISRLLKMLAIYMIIQPTKVLNMRWLWRTVEV